ncbi:MAG TPA: hypothetical protein VG125_33685 [Pirellulales bacterium]|jgi:hypothetical protein|nr:hypothetical protein [Pirellulales bacterium]
MDELLENCRKLCSGNFHERARAYHRLRSSRAFAMVSYHMRGLRLTCYEVARLLVDDAPDPLSISARRLLEAQFAQQQAPR